MKPTVGRIVHYYPPEDPLGRAKPAIITEVHNNNRVDLEVFGLATAKLRTTVPMLPDDALGVPMSGHWNWPPRGH